MKHPHHQLEIRNTATTACSKQVTRDKLRGALRLGHTTPRMRAPSASCTRKRSWRPSSCSADQKHACFLASRYPRSPQRRPLCLQVPIGNECIDDKEIPAEGSQLLKNIATFLLFWKDLMRSQLICFVLFLSMYFLSSEIGTHFNFGFNLRRGY